MPTRLALSLQHCMLLEIPIHHKSEALPITPTVNLKWKDNSDSPVCASSWLVDIHLSFGRRRQKSRRKWEQDRLAINRVISAGHGRSFVHICKRLPFNGVL